MKKKVLGLALIAVSAIAMTGMAQNPAAASTTKQENIKGDKKVAKEGRKQVNPFEGMNLNDAQKSQLQQLDSKRKADREQAAKERKENKQKNDAARAEGRKTAKKAYLADVKSILTPEQYTVFLENLYVNGGNHKSGKKFADGRKGGKNHGNRKGDMKGNRPDRGAKSASNAAKSNS